MSSALVSMRRLALVAVSAVALAVGCASTSKSKVHTMPSGPEQRFSMVGSGLQTDAVISKDGAQGPSINVGRYDDGKAIRGTVNNFPLNITVSGTHAEGQWGSGPLSVDVEEQADQLKMTGLVAGRPSNWTASGEAIKGNIGLCSYDLTRQGDVYVGGRSCAGGIAQVTVQFPSTITEWQPVNIGVLMALLMSTP